MHAVRVLPSETVATRDALSGLELRRLTNATGHSHHLYFTKPTLSTDGRYLIHASERAHDATSSNELWACDLSDGTLLQLSNGGPNAAPAHTLGYSALRPDGLAVACWQHGALQIIDLRDGSTTTIHHAGAHEIHGLSWTCDGRWVLTCVSEDSHCGNGANTSERNAWLDAPPLSQVIAVAADGSGTRVLHQERWLITHVNPSPTDPDLCTFCHEGPWLNIGQRIWGLRLSGGAPWRIAPTQPEWGIGHEYWLSDGRTVGFHARHRDGTWRHAAGFADALTGVAWQAEIAVPTHHCVAITPDLIIADGTRASGEYLMAIERCGDGWDVPRVICRHDASRHHHRAHVHARLGDDARSVVFTSDQRGYCDVYLVRLPQRIADLPPYPGKPFRYYWE